MMAYLEQERKNRIASAFGVAAVHALLAYAFITGLAFEAAGVISDPLKIFQIPSEPPPPPAEKSLPAQQRSEAQEGAASPTSLKAQPSPIVVPPPKIRLAVRSPVVTTPKPTPVTPGTSPSAGVSTVPGPGTGTGGEGVGTGNGGQGSGTGGGGAARAERVSGAISGARDYPRASRLAGIQGTVVVRFTVQTDGRVSGCRVTKSSVNAQLEATTCRLIEQRFRYRPARDAQGNPIPETVSRAFDWLLPAGS